MIACGQIPLRRRDFLVTLGATLACRVGSHGQATRLKAGFLGASYSHARDKIKIVGAHPAFELAGATEESETVRKNYPALRWLSREELLRTCDVIVVESEVRDHGRDALAALRAGKHVHVEKPPATTYGEMREMVELAGEKRLLLQSGYMWRYHPGFDAIFEAVRNGWLGDVYQVHGVMNNRLGRERRAEWAEFKGGSFFEQASHLVDVLIRLLGKPTKVTPFLSSTAGDALMDNNVAVFEFRNALGVISNSTNQPNASAHRSFEVRGTNGTMLLKPIEPPTLLVDLANAGGQYRKGVQTVSLPAYARYTGEIEDLAQALTGSKSLKVSLDEELLVQEWLLRACGMFEA